MEEKRVLLLFHSDNLGEPVPNEGDTDYVVYTYIHITYLLSEIGLSDVKMRDQRCQRRYLG